MATSLIVMAALGAVFALVGLPILLDPAEVRARLGVRDTPQMVYVLRIVGTMVASLGLILLVFAATFWASAKA